MQHRIAVEGRDIAFPCGEGESVLAAMQRAGRAGAIAVGCRSGGCGVCRVAVVEGRYATGNMSGAQITADCRARGIVLACQLFPESDLRVRALGKRIAGGGDDPYRRLFASVGPAYSPSSN